jgi:hypothetical protein
MPAPSCKPSAGGRAQPEQATLGTASEILANASSQAVQPWTFGVDEFTNRGHDTVTLDRVTLLHPRHEHLISSWAMPGAALIGVVPGPPHVAYMPSTWEGRRPAHGFRLGPGKPVVIVVDVAPTAAGLATSQGMTICHDGPAGA